MENNLLRLGQLLGLEFQSETACPILPTKVHKSDNKTKIFNVYESDTRRIYNISGCLFRLNMPIANTPAVSCIVSLMALRYENIQLMRRTRMIALFRMWKRLYCNYGAPAYNGI